MGQMFPAKKRRSLYEADRPDWNSKLKHWRGVPDIFGLRGAPVLGFDFQHTNRIATGRTH
jgi:hypothetical protein